jgi:hypothetical protein
MTGDLMAKTRLQGRVDRDRSLGREKAVAGARRVDNNSVLPMMLLG